MKADLILQGNVIFDSVSDTPFEGFAAISGKRILAVGKPEEMEAFAGKDTKILTFRDKLIMPGFHDAHTHLILSGMYKTMVNLGEGNTEEACARIAKDFYDAHPTPKDQWFIGFNWYQFRWPEKNFPTRHSLDAYFPDQPVLLLNAEAHNAWVNTRALEAAGITRDTPDPFGGEIKKDENGEPTGFLYESALKLCSDLALRFSPELEKQMIRNYMTSANALGITSLIDVQPYFGMDLGSLEVYRAMEDEGELTVRIHAAGNLFGDLDEAKARSEKYRSEKVRANLLKQFVDGVIPTHTALMLEDYYDEPGNRGIQLNKLDQFEEAIYRAHERELSVKVHAIGDYAIRFTLDCYENAISKLGKNKARHAIEHLELVHEDDFSRFRTLGIVPSVQPEHVGLIPTWEQEEYRYVLGEEKAGKTWPFRRLLEEAGMLALGSDCPVVDNNPFFGIHRGLTRLHDDGLPEGGWNPGQKLTVAELLKGYTAGSAYSASREDEIGTLEPGKFADIAVVDRNLFTARPEEIREARVVMTVMDGRIVYEG